MKSFLIEFAGTVSASNLANDQEFTMKVQTGIKAGAHGVEASHGGKPRPIGKGV